MTPGQVLASEAALLQLFLGQQSCNTTYMVDSSEDMRAALGSVKRLLIRTLMEKASRRDSLFNIVTFSGELSCCFPHMLPCAPDTVSTALSWIHSLGCSPGRDLLSALSLALSDPSCHAVHLLCTLLPEHPQAVLAALPALAAGRQVNLFYLLQDSGAKLDGSSREYLERLARTTGGSCWLITVMNGELGQVAPLCAPVSSPSMCFHPSSSVLFPHSVSSPLLRCTLGNCVCGVRSGPTVRLQQYVPGCRVLARRQRDGLYYLGTVIQQVQTQSCGGLWSVEFDPPGASSSLRLVSSQRELVCSFDMMKHTHRSHTCFLAPGDAVLSPWEPEMQRYGPGRVMAAMQSRDGDGALSVRVLMWNSCVVLAPATLLFPISSCQHDRIVRRLQTPSSRLGCSSSSCSSCSPQLLCSRWCRPSSSCCLTSTRRLHLSPPSCRSCCGPGAGSEREEHLDLTDTDMGKSVLQVPSSSCSSSTSSRFNGNETRVPFPPEVKVRSKDQRPPWRYWRRTGAEPQHRQPGSVKPSRTSQPPRFRFPEPELSSSPNHSSLFQSLPASKVRRANMRDVFGASSFKPHPPKGLRPFSSTGVYA